MAAEINNIPYKIYLSEDEIPKAWYNVRADMKVKPAPLLNPGTGKPMGFEDLRPVFCDELIRQELDNDDREIPIPQEILDFYKMYRPSPLVRAYCLEKALGTPAKIYYKFEGNNTSGSHKLNSAIAQAYYAKQQGLKGVTTEMSGRTLAKVEVMHWCENVLALGWIGLFFVWGNPVSLVVAVVAALAAFFLEILIDNNFARVKWQLMLKSAWAVALVAGGINIAVLMYL